MEYLEGFPSMLITYSSPQHSGNLLTGYADSNWGNRESLSSTSGNLMLYNKAPIMSQLKMQWTTAFSTAEAEYYPASTGAAEVKYLRTLLNSMGFTQKALMNVYEDNNACIEWRHNIIGGCKRAKHID
jgi:hypothetical protein